MNAERKEAIRNTINKVLEWRHKIHDAVRNHKETIAVSLLLLQQGVQTVAAQSSVKDKKLNPITAVANQQVKGNYIDWNSFLENGQRLSEERMSAMVDKAIKDGYLLPQLDSHFAA